MRHLIADEGYPEALHRFLCKTGATPVIQNDVAALPARFERKSAVRALSSGRHRPAVDDVFGARNGGGARRSQKGDKIGHFFGFGRSTERYSTEPIHDYLLPTLIIRAGLF